MAIETILTMDSHAPSPVAMDALAARLLGDLVRPGDAAYETARAVHNAAVDRRPALIAFCADAADVIAVVDFAREQGFSVAVRSGGHSLAGYGTCDGGVLVDLSRTKRVTLIPCVGPRRHWIVAAMRPAAQTASRDNQPGVRAAAMACSSESAAPSAHASAKATTPKASRTACAA